ncbi:MAG: aspartate ammonia-lyase, partial [Candidatus Kryptonium sp.]
PQRVAPQNAHLATPLTPHRAEDKAAQIVKKAMAENKTIREVVLELGWMKEDELDKILDIRKMTEGGFVAGVSAGG